MTLTGLSALLFTCLEGPRTRDDKLLQLTNSYQPKTVQVSKVVAGIARTLALNDGVSPEILEATTSRCQRLSAALVTCSSVLTENIPSVKTHHTNPKMKSLFDLSHREERVSRPQTPPARRACRDRGILAVKRHCRWNSLTHHTAADVGQDLLAKDRHHWYWCGGGEPVGFVITTRVVAGSFVAIGERHGGENREAGASLAYSERKERHTGREHVLLLQLWIVQSNFKTIMRVEYEGDTYLDLECELFLVLPSTLHCSPPRAECCPQDTVVPQLTDCGSPEENLIIRGL